MNDTFRDHGHTAPAFAPIHIKGADAIAELFGVARNTVVGWARKGAPIRLVGKKYQANYLELWGWIKQETERSSARARLPEKDL